jgi:uncharacterized membrane protein
MEIDALVRLVFRWLHILPAVILLGGVFFMRLAVLPAAAGWGEKERLDLQDALRRRWAKWVGISAGLLLLSGIVNTVLIVRQYQVPGLYHGLLLVKILLALAIIFIASTLAGRSAAAERFRQKEAFWLNLNLALSVLLICVAGVMRMTDRTEKSEAAESRAAVSRPPWDGLAIRPTEDDSTPR